jgi:hypothetical protein
VFGTPFAAQRGGLGDTPQRTHEQAEAQQPIERDGQRLKCGAFHYWFNPAHLKLSYNHITMMMVVALILMFRSISTCCPFSVCVCVCVCVTVRVSCKACIRIGLPMLGSTHPHQPTSERCDPQWSHSTPYYPRGGLACCRVFLLLRLGS